MRNSLRNAPSEIGPASRPDPNLVFTILGLAARAKRQQTVRSVGVPSSWLGFALATGRPARGSRGGTDTSQGLESSFGKPARVLIVDDNQSIHDDFRRILDSDSGSHTHLDSLEAMLFGGESASDDLPRFDLDAALQGQQALEKVVEARAAGRPFAMAFVDVRMPPGWDGVETTTRLWAADPHLQVVICTAYSDYTWRDLAERLGRSSRLLVLKKPFDAIEVRQMACALSEKWALSRAHEAHVAGLETAVGERTAELEEANRRLSAEMAARQRAESAARQAQKLEALGRLTGGLSHAINNPLAVLHANLGFARDLLERRRNLSVEEGVDLRDALGECLQAVGRIGTSVRELRALVGEGVSVAGAVALDDVLDDALAIRAAAIRERAELRVERASVPWVRGDVPGLSEVFGSLLDNALQSFPTDRPLAENWVRVCVELLADDLVEVSVADNGVGMTSEVLDSVFDPFYSGRGREGSLGLGLSVSRGIVRSLGGRIAIESEPNKGTTVRVFLTQGQRLTPADPAMVV